MTPKKHTKMPSIFSTPVTGPALNHLMGATNEALSLQEQLTKKIKDMKSISAPKELNFQDEFNNGHICVSKNMVINNEPALISEKQLAKFQNEYGHMDFLTKMQYDIQGKMKNVHGGNNSPSSPNDEEWN